MQNGGTPWTGSAAISDDLKRRILEIDDRLELHHIGALVHCYRVTAAAILVHQFVLKWPPGDWLIDCLRCCDQWKRSTPAVAAKKQLKLYKSPNDVAVAVAEAKMREIHEAVRPEFNKYVDRKSSFSFPARKVR